MIIVILWVVVGWVLLSVAVGWVGTHGQLYTTVIKMLSIHLLVAVRLLPFPTSESSIVDHLAFSIYGQTTGTSSC